jgi:ribosomal protein L11 methylase PrmA
VLKGRAIRKAQLQTIVDSLRTTVEGLSWRAADTEWANYTSDNNYTDTATRSKRELVAAYLRQATPRTVWDLGANTGEYSRIAREQAAFVVAFDADPAAVELHYRLLKRSDARGILPLLVNLMNPSPAQGWAHGERMSFAQRGPADVVMALALIHHLAISNNVPLPLIAEFFARLTDFLIVEFVPKSDSQVKRLLLNRPDIFEGYTQPGFERAFGAHFEVLRAQRVEESERTLYLMRRRRASEV